MRLPLAGDSPRKSNAHLERLLLFKERDCNKKCPYRDKAMAITA